MPDQARASPVCASFTRMAPAASGRAHQAPSAASICSEACAILAIAGRA